MFNRHVHAIAVRGLLVAACVAVFAGCNAQTDAAPAATNAPPPGETSAAPVTPAGVVATPGNAQAGLTWSASSGASSYKVSRSTTSGGAYTQIATPSGNSYNDMSLSNGTTYYYVVSAANATGESANSAQVSATPQAPLAAPMAPINVTASPGNSQAALNWTASSGASSYKVSRSTTSGGPYTQIATPAGTSYTDSSLINGTNYYFVVAAMNAAGTSPNSVQVSALPAAPVTNPPPASFGNWYNVSPSNAILTELGCQNAGTIAVEQDPAHPSNLYAEFDCQGVWKSTDYGASWTGPINSGTVTDCAGGIVIPRNSTAAMPTIYQACIRGAGMGFWRSTDGGVNWTRYFVAPSGTGRQDYYPPVVDPYDQNHLVMAGHEMNYLVESVDGGQNWTSIALNGGMMQNGGTASIFFINTGNASTTRGTLLWVGQQINGSIGTWRTSNGGTAWTKVDNNEHPHGSGQIYQPDNNGVVYMAGAYSALGWGVLRSADYGQTWTHVGQGSNESVVVGTSKNLYSMLGFVGMAPAFQVAAQPGTGNWVFPTATAGLPTGSAKITVINDGTHNILLGAMWTSGIWRYIEP